MKNTSKACGANQILNKVFKTGSLLVALITKLYRLIPEHAIFLGMRIVAGYAGNLTVFFKRKVLGHLHLRHDIHPVFACSNPLLVAVLTQLGNIPFYDKTLMRFMTDVAIIGPYGPNLNRKNQ